MTQLLIPGPQGPLESILEEPDAHPARFAVICHPHPLYGGTMDNKVVWTLSRALEEAGVATLRFNFRGVGASAGTYDEGIGETEDAAAVLAFGAEHWPGARPLLAGFSFGAYIALRLAGRTSLEHLITVAPPVGRFDVERQPDPHCPWLIVQGDADEVVDAQAVIAWARQLGSQVELVVLPGVGHFFHGALQLLRDAVRSTLRSG